MGRGCAIHPPDPVVLMTQLLKCPFAFGMSIQFLHRPKYSVPARPTGPELKPHALTALRIQDPAKNAERELSCYRWIMERQAAEYHESILEKILPIARRTLLDHTRQTLAKPSILVFADRDRPEVHIVEESGLTSVLRTVTPLHGRVYRRYDACDDLLACVRGFGVDYRVPHSALGGSIGLSTPTSR